MSGSAGSMLMDQVLAGLTEDELRCRPAPCLNSIAWLLWHLARSEDVLGNVLLAERPQVLDTDDWHTHLNLTQRDMGTGMTGLQVDAVGACVAIPALRDYQLAVGRCTREYVSALQERDWFGAIDPQRLLAVGAFANPIDGTRRVESYWRGRTKAELLTTAHAPHNYQHLGEALAIKSLIRSVASSPGRASE